jgi:serine/threonine protein kinase/Tol biopolymer transport system component
MENQTIAHYRILRQLGAGGMGVVYEAEDIKLERRVALKFLPEATHRDPQALERFLREARSASALNHSGICTIHAIEEHEGRTFIAMELLEGRTLEHVLKAASLPIPRTVEIGIQLAEALDAAHKKGIIHRDIKPANVFLTERGGVKILDFGLAKLMHADDALADGQTVSDQTLLLTSPGTAVGTIAYMSPEQARGEELDARSDLFSVGAVLYEMVTGKLAFPGSTSAVVFDNILHNAPVAPVTLNPHTPAELERILNKALEKDRECRYQGAAELRADLKRLQRELDPARPGSGSTRTTTGTTAAPAASAETPATGTPRPSSGSALVEAAGRNKVGTGVVLGIVVVLLVAAGFGVYSLVKPAPPPPKRLPFEHVEINNLTNNGHVSLARISPDGKYLLHALEENGLQSLWLRHIPTGSNTQVVAPTATRYMGLTFSPDGNYIYFVRRDEAEHTIAILYQAPVLGGIPRVLVRDVDSPVTFSPDGQRFAFLHERHDSPHWDLWTFRNDGSDKQAIFSNKPISSDSKVPVWSPDSKTILIPVTQPDREDHSAFLAVDVATGKQQVVAATPARVYYDSAWLPDGKALIAPAASAASGFQKIQLGYLSYPGGEFRALTTDTNDYVHPSISADGRTIVASQSQFRQQFQIAAADAINDWKPLALSSMLLVWRWAWLPDGRLVMPQGGDIRIVNPGGGESVVFSDHQHLPDQVTVCGKSYIVFRQIGRSGESATNLWRMNLDGTEQKQLTNGLNDTEPACTSDGKWVYYTDAADNRYVKRVPVEGGPVEAAMKSPVAMFSLSPDGTKTLTLEVRDFDHKLVLRADNVETHATEYLNVDPRISVPFAYWPDGKSIVYNVREHGVDNLWRQGLDGSGRKQLTHFTSERIGYFAFSPDGAKLAVERGHLESDAVLLRDTSK